MPAKIIETTSTFLTPEEAIPSDLDGHWWVAHTRARNEKALARDLGRLGVAHYLPLRCRVTRSKRTGRRSQSTVPVFSGYLFFNADEQQRYRVLATNRVASTLYAHEQDELVIQLRHVHRVLLAGTEFEHLYKVQVGQWVRVVGGPLADLEGCVVKKLSQTRLSVNVMILGQAVLVDVDGNLLEPIEPPQPVRRERPVYFQQ